jgi:hypothetical protein
MDKKIAISVIIATLLLTFGGVFMIAKSQQPANTGFDNFARCLTSKGAVMYGAAGCIHCQKVKSDFGSSFQYINYVECPLNPQKCLDEGVDGYPTWKFSDGSRLEGEQPLQKISEVSGCPIPVSK